MRHDLEVWLREYIAAAGIENEARTAPLFRSAVGKQRRLTTDAYPAHSMRRMLKRRLSDAGFAGALRVSTDDQDTSAQVTALKTAGGGLPAPNSAQRSTPR